MAGLILQAQGKDEEARKRYERIVEKDPHAAVASNNLAWMYASRGEQLDRALQLAQAAVAQVPEGAACVLDAFKPRALEIPCPPPGKALTVP